MPYDTYLREYDTYEIVTKKFRGETRGENSKVRNRGEASQRNGQPVGVFAAFPDSSLSPRFPLLVRFRSFEGVALEVTWGHLTSKYISTMKIFELFKTTSGNSPLIFSFSAVKNVIGSCTSQLRSLDP